MRTGLIASAAAAIIAAAVPAASTASAEEFGIHAGEGGVGIHVGDDHHHRDHWRESRGFHREGCRTTTVKHRGPDGTVVVRKSRTCD